MEKKQKEKDQVLEKLLTEKLLEANGGFVLIVTKGERYLIQSIAHNTTAFEILGFLENKKQDILNQLAGKIKPKFKIVVIN